MDSSSSRPRLRFVFYEWINMDYLWFFFAIWITSIFASLHKGIDSSFDTQTSIPSECSRRWMKKSRMVKYIVCLFINCDFISSFFLFSYAFIFHSHTFIYYNWSSHWLSRDLSSIGHLWMETWTTDYGPEYSFNFRGTYLELHAQDFWSTKLDFEWTLSLERSGNQIWSSISNLGGPPAAVKIPDYNTCLQRILLSRFSVSISYKSQWLLIKNRSPS